MSGERGRRGAGRQRTDGVEHGLVRHGHADRAARAQALLHVVPKVVVAARQVGKERIEVAGLLHAIADAGELVREVLAPRLGGVEVGLNGLCTEENEC